MEINELILAQRGDIDLHELPPKRYIGISARQFSRLRLRFWPIIVHGLFLSRISSQLDKEMNNGIFYRELTYEL
jgi:uncharacterized protein (UPF0276 family)